MAEPRDVGQSSVVRRDELFEEWQKAVWQGVGVDVHQDDHVVFEQLSPR